MGRPKGSKSKNREGYAKRTEDLKRLYGDDIFHRWGKKGGNPLLVRRRE